MTKFYSENLKFMGPHDRFPIDMCLEYKSWCTHTCNVHVICTCNMHVYYTHGHTCGEPAPFSAPKRY